MTGFLVFLEVMEAIKGGLPGGGGGGGCFGTDFSPFTARISPFQPVQQPTDVFINEAEAPTRTLPDRHREATESLRPDGFSA